MTLLPGNNALVFLNNSKGSPVCPCFRCIPFRLYFKGNSPFTIRTSPNVGTLKHLIIAFTFSKGWELMRSQPECRSPLPGEIQERPQGACRWVKISFRWILRVIIIGCAKVCELLTLFHGHLKDPLKLRFFSRFLQSVLQWTHDRITGPMAA